MTLNIPTEHQEQVALVRWFELQYPNVLIFAVPNGGKRHVATAKKFKAEGVKAGIPDLCVPKFNLWIEMKRIKGGQLSQSQKDMIEHLKSINHTVIVGKGFVDAKNQIETFMRQFD